MWTRFNCTSLNSEYVHRNILVKILLCIAQFYAQFAAAKGLYGFVTSLPYCA